MRKYREELEAQIREQQELKKKKARQEADAERQREATFHAHQSELARRKHMGGNGDPPIRDVNIHHTGSGEPAVVMGGGLGFPRPPKSDVRGGGFGGAGAGAGAGGGGGGRSLYGQDDDDNESFQQHPPPPPEVHQI